MYIRKKFFTKILLLVNFTTFFENRIRLYFPFKLLINVFKVCSKKNAFIISSGFILNIKLFVKEFTHLSVFIYKYLKYHLNFLHTLFLKRSIILI